MSNPVQNFEFILKKNNTKRTLGLYSDIKQQKKHTIKPQDVISSVSMQLKAIQVADSLKSDKSAAKDLQKYKKSNFPSVNNLPVYDEVPKATTKFDTQCVSDTQLINIIEDAELIDVHRGMTQEFETTFIHHTEKHSLDDDEEIDENVCIEKNEKVTKNVETVDINKVTKNVEALSDKESMNKIHDNITKAVSANRIENDLEADNSISLIFPIMCSNNVMDRESGSNGQGSKINENAQIEEDCIEIEEDIDIDKSIERPLSPIFMHKNVKFKSKTPSPLVFDLEKFEQFENSDMKTVKQVINSQILDKELCFKIDEDILLNDRDILSSPVQNKDVKVGHREFKTHTVKDPSLNTDLEFIELDKATSEDLINKVMSEVPKSSKIRAKSEILKDEILFSSDEEDNYVVHKSYQDLPFSCALETSFYDQSDVLDKTMYVGFQTASNKSIQIFTESFAQAKSILSGEMTVTDLVNNCDSSVKNKMENDESQAKIDLDVEETEYNLAQKESEPQFERNEAEKPDNIQGKSINVEGFMTASKKEIKLSQKALARCKKVFQDIDLNENWDTQIEEENVEEHIELNRDENKNVVEEDIQNIDDEIIQEFENIEMSLKEDKEPDKNMNHITFQTSRKDLEISETAKIKDVINDIDFDEDLTEVNIRETEIEENALPIEIEDPKSSDITLQGFKTASNKNIKISKEALAKTKNIFQDLGSTELPNKSSKSIDKEYPNLIDFEQPSTSKAEFVGFKTANNKNIKISEKALAKVHNIFKDIDKTELPKKNDKDEEEKNNEDFFYNQPSTSKMTFLGFKTANNREINISKDALAKTKKIFEEINSAVFILPKKKNTDPTKIYPEQSEQVIDFYQSSTSTSSCVGFKTASNKNVKISDAALIKTKNIFKDIDATDFKFPDKGKKIDTEKIIEDGTKAAEPIFKGFKTANNIEIKISDNALAKTKDIFKDLDSDGFKYPSKHRKNIEEDDYKRTHEIEMIDLNMPSRSTASFAGFKTANNKKIKITKEALAKTKNIFNDINATDSKIQDKGVKGVESVEDIMKISVKKVLQEAEDISQPSTSKTSFIGFKTANNRKISISTESLAKTKNIFKDIDASNFKFPEKVNKNLERADFIENKNKESEIMDNNQPSTSKEIFVGFKTANDKKINICKESLAKTKNVFKDIDTNDFACTKKTEKELQDTVTEGKSPHPNLKESIQTKTSKNSFIGFKTANNKLIKVSEIAVAKSKNLFKDIYTIELKIPEKVKDDYPDIEIEDIEPKINIETGSVKTRNNHFKMPGSAVPKFQGFQTASNKEVKVSDEAVIKSRKLFQDIEMSQDFNFQNDGKDVLDAVKDPFHIHQGINNDAGDFNTDDLPINAKSSPIFKGFQTANKKPVKISEEALAKSRKLFQDIQTIQDEPEPEFHGFKTGNDGEIEVSQKAFIETKKLFEVVIKRSGFQGFQTASDKKVSISEDALVKSRKIFQDIDKKETVLQNNEKKATDIKFGFKTGSNRDVEVSEEAVRRSKRRFSEIDYSKENTTNYEKDTVTNEDNVANIIDTQVLNNFNESLHTEDFHDTPIKSKRSGSPILSCPRAKKRKKFETPYSQKVPETVKKHKDIMRTTKDTNKLIFTENYKKNQKYTLKDLAELTKNYNKKIDPHLLKFTFDDLLQFELHESRNELTDGNMKMESLKEFFLNSVNSKLIPTGWIENHLKLILWKLISYEIKFRCLVVTARNLIDQLKYRYDKELYNAQRPALRKILEKDDVASKTLVLCVAEIYVDGVGVASATTTNNPELLLTDGWYCIKAIIDKMLAQLVCQGKIVVGSKIVTNGAELMNCEQGISPWEDTSAVRLKLSGNSTRRARWDARLGYHGNGAILSQLSSVKLDGGKVSKLRVFVTRVYPALYVEKFEDGSTVTRSERLEHLHQMKSEAERQAIMEKIYEEVEQEFSDEESQDSESLTELTNKRTCFDSGSQIAKVMKRSKDPAEFRAGLTSSQTRLLESHTAKHREHLLQNIQQKIRQKIEKAGVCENRSVVTLLKIRVAGLNGMGKVSKGMMSIWKPPEAVLEIIKEGAWIDVMNVVPTAVRYSEIQISAGRQSVFNSSKYKEPEKCKHYTNLKRNCYAIQDLSHNPLMATDYNEIDTVGFIFLIDPSIREFDSTKQPFQNVFLADADKNMICINFWGGLKKFGYQNVFDTGQIVYGANLQKRAGNTRKSIPEYRVTEFSYFTKTPKNENARILVDDLSKKFLSLDRRKFCDDCVVLKNNYAVIKLNNENISPYRFNTSDFNMSKNKMFIDSPLARPNKIDDNFNLTGLDFESTFKQTDTQNLSEEVLQRKKKVNEKIARLKMYGEPPPLSTIHIINRSKHASNSFKSPLNSNKNHSKIIPEKSKSESAMPKSDSSLNVASVKYTPEKCGNSNDSDVVCSPVLLNRTYVKSVNPVKINFDVKDNNDSNVDHFAEEFDGSPPLSLD